VNPKTKQHIEQKVQTASIAMQAYRDALATVRGYATTARAQKVDAPTQQALDRLLRVAEMEFANAAAALRAYEDVLAGKEPFG